MSWPVDTNGTPVEIANAIIVNERFSFIEGTTTTICHVTTLGGFVTVGKSACVDPARFNAELGRTYAREDAMRQLVEHVAFWLCLSRSQP